MLYYEAHAEGRLLSAQHVSRVANTHGFCNGANKSFGQLHAHEHTVVGVEQGAQAADGGVGRELAHLLHHRQELVALEKEAEIATRHDNLRTDTAEAGEVGHRDGVGGGVERVVAAEVVLADGGSIGAVAVERESAGAGGDAHLA